MTRRIHTRLYIIHDSVSLTENQKKKSSEWHSRTYIITSGHAHLMAWDKNGRMKYRPRSSDMQEIDAGLI